MWKHSVKAVVVFGLKCACAMQDGMQVIPLQVVELVIGSVLSN